MKKLNAITENWHKRCNTQPGMNEKFILLNQKKKKKNIEAKKDVVALNKQYHNPASSQKRLIKKLTNFIQKIEETLKKILYQKDVKWYITYAHTSETQIMDSVTKSLNKFKQILCQLKQRPVVSQILIPMHNSLFSSSSESVLKGLSIIQNKKSIEDRENNKNRKFNFDVLQFVLQYFQQHMIPETHWSRNSKQVQKAQKTQKDDFFSKYFGKLKFNCYTPHQEIQNLAELELVHTMTHICQQINRQDKQTGFIQNEIPKQIFSKPVQQTLNAILKIQQLKSIQDMTSIQKIAYLLDLQSKVFVSSQFVQTAAYFQDDITTLPKNKFQHVWKFINENDLGNQKTLNEQYKMMKMLMIITNASVIRQLQINSQENSWFKKIVFGLSFPRYFFDYGRAKLQNHKFLRKPSVHTTKSIWNLPQNGFIKRIKQPFIFDSIKCNLEFYVPRTNSRNLKNFNKRTYDSNLNIFIPNQNSIRIRLLNYKELDIGNKKPYNQIYDTIIIHYHGGGFIALSSCTSQSYTRKWANALKIPVFSVDYGKPPEFRFPTPVLDCLDSYNFISNEIHKYLNIKPQRIFVTGDSAGGNLACSLTALTMKLQMKIPDGLLLAYPAVDTRQKFTPSRINSFNDIILYPTLLILCMREYLGEDSDNQFNPLASPILLTQQFVNDSLNDKRWPLKWPKSIIIVGKKDPLYDDSLRLCERLASSNIQFHCEIYKNLSHAFLSIDKMLPQCAQQQQILQSFLKCFYVDNTQDIKNLFDIQYVVYAGIP